MLRVLIVDDEPLAHKVLLHHLQLLENCRVVGQCYNATEALAWLANNQTDVIFLDINMPALSGIDMLKVLANKPQVVIVSAYQEYALQGFELDVTDYLLKPVTAERFNQAIDKVTRRAKQGLSRPSPEQSILVKVDREKRKVALNSISLLEAYGNYVKLWQGESMILVNSTLKQILEELPDADFIQIHKSFVVNKNKVIGVDSDTVRLSDNRQYKIGRAYRANINSLL